MRMVIAGIGGAAGAGGRRWTAVVLAAVLLLAVPFTAWAHGVLRRSNPEDGARLSTAPRELRLTFSEDVELAVARVGLAGPEGEVALGPLALAADSPRVLVAPIAGGLVAGAYTIRWQIVGQDGHPVRGELAFAIEPGAAGLRPSPGPAAPGQQPPPESHHPPAPPPSEAAFDAQSPAYAAVRWLTYLALAGVIGAVAFRFAVLQPLARRRDPAAAAVLAPAAERAARIGLAAAAVLAVAAVLRLLAQSYALHGTAGALDPRLVGTMLARTLWGWGWLVQAAGTVAVVAGFRAAMRTGAAAADPVRRREARRTAPAYAGGPVDHAADADRSADADRRADFDRPMDVDRPGDAHHPIEMDRRGDAHHPIDVDRPGDSDRPIDADRTAEGGRFAARTTPGWMIAAAGVLLLAVFPALSGHAAAASGPRGLAIAADAVHVLGAGGWIGGLFVLLAAGVASAARLEPGTRGPAVAALVNAFSPAALAFAGALVLTGVFAAWLHLGSLPALWESGYGRTLLVKLALLSGVFATGAYNWRRVRPALAGDSGTRRLRTSAAAEIAIGAAVLLATAVLVATMTPHAS